MVDYAASKFITIIPEIELPGHGVAALAAYPHLGCTGENYEVRTKWGVSTEIFCAGKETTFEFWSDVLSEVIELFPSEYIHIGGDECPKTEWERCPLCQARIKSEGLEDEHELQAYVANRVEKFLSSKGRKMIGWDEILDADNLSTSAVIMSWRGTNGGITAAKRGNHVVMSPNTYCYFDYYQTEDRESEPIAMGRRVLTLERVYSFDPYEGLDESERGYIKGVQANVWSEYMKDLSHMQYMILPRLTALSEVAWSYGGQESYVKFLTRVESLLNLYDFFGFNYAMHAFVED